MELYPGIHMVETQAGEKILNQFLLVGSDRIILIDSGWMDTPETVLFPYLDSINCHPSKIWCVINTHADVDHVAGNHAIKQSVPGAWLMAHEIDVPLIESAKHIVECRYDQFQEFGVRYDAPTRKQLFEDMGICMPIDLHLRGGETLEVEPGWHVRILHTPGHSLGHLSIIDTRNKVGIITDALLGKGEVNRAGRWFAPPTYLTVTGYLNSIAEIERLNLSALLRSHRAPIVGAEVQQFLRESRTFVHDLSTIVMDTIRQRPGATMSELMAAADDVLGPFCLHLDWVYSLKAHLYDLESKEVITRTCEKGDVGWRLTTGRFDKCTASI